MIATLSTTKKEEMEEIAIILADKVTPSGDEITAMTGVAHQVVGGIEWALKMAYGEISRPKRNREWLKNITR